MKPMTSSNSSGAWWDHDPMATDSSSTKRHTAPAVLQQNQEEYSFRLSSTTSEVCSQADHDGGPPPPPSESSPASSWDQAPLSWEMPTSPLTKSPWSSHMVAPEPESSPSNSASSSSSYSYTGLMGSLVREEGHIYSLAAVGELLYTGSDSKNIRVWKNQKEFSGFKSNSGLVKAIIIAGERIFTGHQDGKIRVWKISGKDPSVYKRIGSLPTFKATVKSSFNPHKYVEVSKNRNAIWIKHIDAISALSLSEDKSVLYSASWDKTIKVWRVSDYKCLESVTVHDDAVNSVVAGFDGLVFTGSADGTVKVWRRETQGKGTKHFFSQTLLKQECAVTALAVDPLATILYCGSSDGMINFWGRDKFLSRGGILRRHKLAVLCLATARNMLFSGSADTNICVWRREEGQHTCVSLLSGHSGPVKCLSVEEDCSHGGGGGGHFMVYSGSLDKSVKIWRVSAHAVPELPPMSPPAANSSQSFSQSGGSSRPGQRRKS